MGRLYGSAIDEFKWKYYTKGECEMFKGVIVGRMGTEPSQRSVGQHSVVEFTVPSSRKVKGEEKTDWIKVSVWGKQGEYVLSYGAKGRIVSVSGDVYQDSYTAKDGSIKTTLNMKADSVSLHGPKLDSDRKASALDNNYDITAKVDFTSDDLPF